MTYCPSDAGTPFSEDELRRLLGGRIGAPAVQVFINLMDCALLPSMITDLKKVVDKFPETHSDFGKLVEALQKKAKCWSYDAQREAARRAEIAPTRTELSWDNYYYDGTPQRSGAESLLPNFGFGNGWNQDDELRVWGSDVERAFSHTKYSRTKGVDVSTLNIVDDSKTNTSSQETQCVAE
ncbi:hypothetical protein SLS56_010895 [Neofusicoccum ribis]|uniref:Uncharacterized protein n=1 Tax=Neofusicoccum ribis TaxID=45134 RepID=A0ABR3SD49_9PEZI